MNFPLFVARRIRKTQDTSFSKTVTYVGVGTVAVGTAIILVSFAILFGFKSTIEDKLTNFSGDARISQISGNHSLSEIPLVRNRAWEAQTLKRPEIDHIQAHVQRPGIIVGKDGLAGIVVKGIGKDLPVKQLEKNIISGSGSINGPQEVILSKTLAKQLKVKTNNSLIIYFLSAPERPRKVKIKGIYETGLEEIDKIFVLADRDWVQKMNGWTSDSLGTYEIFFKENQNLEAKTNALAKSMPPEWRIQPVTEIYPALFDWMSMLDKNIVIFISLLFVVACFNLIATLWVLIMERVPMVGLLKSMGASASQIRRIFWWNGLFILVRGLVIGNGIAFLFCYLQSSYQLLPLDPESYYMNSVPIQWDAPTWIMVNALTILLVSFMMSIPTLLITKIEPNEALNFKN
ncbi:ABC transporter permease [Aquirufa sp.]|jgi:lipoprotein-releasing system permease protein|uniref:ABC transporter permease n=1 Tax=Aquirufa sp. TaxID=2676249 RepID=UPI0037832BEC